MDFNAKLATMAQKWEEAHKEIVEKQKERIDFLCNEKFDTAFVKISGKDTDQRAFAITLSDLDVDAENPLQAETVEYLQKLGFVKGLDKKSWFKRVIW